MSRRPWARLDDSAQARIRKQAADGVSFRDIGASHNIGVRVVAKVVDGTYSPPKEKPPEDLPSFVTKKPSVYSCGNPECVRNLHRALSSVAARIREHKKLQRYIASLLSNNDPVLLNEFKAIKRRCEAILKDRNA